MFPTTVWTTVRQAAGDDAQARDLVVRTYRAPVLGYLRAKGASPDEAEDVCHEVFLALFAKGVLGRADARRGSFRALLATVTRRALQHTRRQRREEPRDDLEPSDGAPEDADESFDREWVLALVERAFERLDAEGSPYSQVVRAHLAGEPQDRNRLWIARRKLQAWIRHEVALCCSSPREIEDELAHLARYMRPIAAERR